MQGRKSSINLTGKTFNNLYVIGEAEERKSKTNFKQISYVFLGEVLRDKGELSLTEKEIGEGATMLWVEPEEALKLIDGSIENLKGSPVDELEDLYMTKFIIYRDRNILKFYIDSKNN